MSDVKQTQNATTNAAKVGGRRIAGRLRKKNSSENIKIPSQVMQHNNGAAASKMHHSYPMATNIVDLSMGSTATSILGHKQKLKGQVAREKISKGVKAPNATGFDLNNPPIDEAKNQFGPDWLWESMIRRETGADSNGSGGGKKNSSNGVAYESAVGPATTVKSEPFIEENEAAMYPPPIKNVGSSSHSIMIKLEPFDTETSEIQPHAMEENDAGRDAKILKFDLNEVPADGGEE